MKKINYLLLILSIIIYILGMFVIKFVSGNSNYELYYVGIIALPCILIYLYTIKLENEKDKKVSLIMYLIAYIIVLLGFVFSNRTTLAYASNTMLRDYNLIPFKSIIGLFKSPYGIGNALYNIIGNFLMLTPLSLLLPRITIKYNKLMNFILTITILTIFIEITQYILNIGSLDVDDFILNFTGALLFYYLFNKTKFKKYIDIFIYQEFKYNKIYIYLYYIFLILTIICIIYFSIDLYISFKSKQIDISKLSCIDKNKTFIVNYHNYNYYTKCNYDNSYIYIGDLKYTLEDYILSQDYNKSYDNKIGIIKEKIITDVEVIKGSNIKLIYCDELNNNCFYLVNIDNIKYKKNNDAIDINDIFETDINPLDLVDLYRTYINDNYAIYTGDYYNVISCENNNKYNDYIVPIDYSLDNTLCKSY